MSRKAAHETDRKAELLLAARNLIFVEGTAKLTMRRVGEAVSITEPAVYRHFRNKEELLRALIEFMFEGWQEKLDGLREASMPASKKLLRLGTLHLTHLFEHQFNPVLLLSEANMSEQPAIKATLNAKGELMFEAMAAMVREGCESGEFPADLNVKSACLALLGTLQGSLIRWTLTRSTRGLAADVEGALRLIIRGLAAQGG
ncbi:MAG TPA: TetR/AcrR family transcriptional regulator [Candidatus Ozemobacteraceae bacterium]|nr:TetR/AcrR family transcriptional regulator [Candidatus Ozemobacteraceae bacterium]